MVISSDGFLRFASAATDGPAAPPPIITSFLFMRRTPERFTERFLLCPRRHRSLSGADLSAGGSSGFLVGLIRCRVLEILHIPPEGLGCRLASVGQDQVGGNAGSIGDDLPAMKGMVTAEPLIVPFRGQIPAKGEAVLVNEAVRDLVEEPVQAGVSIELIGRLLGRFLRIRAFWKAASLPWTAPTAITAPVTAPQVSPKSPTPPPNPVAIFFASAGRPVSTRLRTASVTHSAQLYPREKFFLAL